MGEEAASDGTIIFASVGRSHYAFDVFSVDRHSKREQRLTDGKSINFNAQFVMADAVAAAGLDSSAGIVFVSERRGTGSIFFSRSGESNAVPLVDDSFLYCDKPSFAIDGLVFASTKVGGELNRRPSTAIFSKNLATGETRRLSPDGVADYSPAVSPSGEWIAVASDLGRDWGDEVDELDTAIVVFSSRDGSNRRVVASRGGWPCWADETTILFHRRAPEDDWWSIYRVKLGLHGNGAGHVDRITPPGVHVFTPAAPGTGADWIAVVTRRPGSKFRQVETFELGARQFVPLTSELHPELHHFNPFVSDEQQIGYHRSRKPETGDDEKIPLLEHVVSPLDRSGVTLLRLDGAFPSVSPCGSFIAYNTDFEADDSGVFVARLDGSGRRRIFKGLAFSTAWDYKRPGVVYTTFGHIFTGESSSVHILSLSFDLGAFQSTSLGPSSLLESTKVKVLTKEGTKNNAFPSSSPDGRIVFRSGRSGQKNLYIMDAEQGEDGGLQRLTEGPWVDTMPSWSPDGEWIAFSSTRDGRDSGTDFSIFMVRPDGTELHRVLPPAGEAKPVKGRFNHVCFSPDSKKLLFTADAAGVSAEPISVANQFQPYGELFTCNLDGSELTRLTHNAYEDGTPCWGPIRIEPESLSAEGIELQAKFQDCLWLDSVTDKMKAAVA